MLIVLVLGILIATLWLPVLKISGSSMNPTLKEGSIVLTFKKKDFKIGDIITFKYNGKIITKRIIAMAGDLVNIDDAGKVYVNDIYLEEAYIEEKALGNSDIKYPYKVPEDSVFVLGDNRAVSIDSRNSQVGCIRLEDVTGKVVFIILPFSDYGSIE